MIIKIELKEDEAEAYAEMLKRIYFDIFAILAQSEEEIYLMKDACLKIQKELAENGIDPR